MTASAAHADREGLLRWISAFTEKPRKVFVVHGEDLTSDLFASTLRNRLSLDAEAPYSGSVFDLAKGAWVTRAAPRRVEKLENKTSRAGAVFARLIAAGQRLMAVIKQNEGLANKELAKFADQINALCDKWQRVSVFPPLFLLYVQIFVLSNSPFQPYSGINTPEA